MESSAQVWGLALAGSPVIYSESQKERQDIRTLVLVGREMWWWNM